MKSPIFILGNPRSGTTLLRLMLHNHKNIVIPPECGFLIWWYETYKKWDSTWNQDKQLVEKFLNDLISSKKFDLWELDRVLLQKRILASSPSSYSDLVSLIYTIYGESTTKKFSRWGDKNNFYISHIKTIHTIFQDAQFIHIIRDGRDVACSYREVMARHIQTEFAPKLPTEMTTIAVEWKRNISNLIDAFDEIGWGGVIEIRV